MTYKSATNPLIQTAVANGDYIYTTTDGWETFTARTAAGSRSWTSVAISATDPLIQTAVVGNAGGYIYTTTDGWETFTQRTAAGSCIAISATDPLIQTRISGAGASKRGIYTTTDGGETWVARTATGSRSWASVVISATDPLIQTAVAYGGGYQHYYGDYIYTTTDGWETFTQRTAAGSRNWRSVAISATDPLIQTAVSGNNVDSINVSLSNSIYTTTDGWETFTARTATGSRSWTSVAISATDPLIQTAVVGNAGGYIYTTTDGWETFTQRTGPGGRIWGSVAMN